MGNDRFKIVSLALGCTAFAAVLCALWGVSLVAGNVEGPVPVIEPKFAHVASTDGSLTTVPARLLTTKTTATPGKDTFVDNQWALDRMNVRAVWNISPRREVTVAVLDTGIDSGHEDLQDVVAEAVNFTASPTVDDLYGHGTHIAGIIAARVNNSLGIAGASQYVKLLNVKVADDTGDCNSANVAKGIVWATDHGANVINLSLTITHPSLELEQSVEYAWNRGAVVVAAVGNDKKSSENSYPAVYKNCLAVVGTNNDDVVTSSLAWKEVIAAPGYHIFSTLPGNNYGYKDGSSMATAYVSAAAAATWACSANLAPVPSNDRIVGLLKDATVPIVSRMLTYRLLDFGKLTRLLDNPEK